VKLSDYLVQYLVDLNVKHVFLVIGGACAILVDAIGKNKNLKYVCTQHEQSAAMAVDAYSRMTQNFGVAVVTSGPGATNLITGICCAYFDSIPCLFIGGQVNIWETKGDKKIRQLGFQETDIIDMVKPITKFAVLVKAPEKIKYYLEKAVYLAKSGRPGPVWLDIPMNVQQAEIDPDTLVGFDPSELGEKPADVAQETIFKILAELKKAKRPVVIAGSGIKLGKAQIDFLEFIKKFRAPVISTWSGVDILPYDHELYIGQFGVYGNRAANFTVQNADLVLSLGSRLDTRQTGGQPKTFARAAKKIVVDIDRGELEKDWVVADLPVCANVKDVLTKLNDSQNETLEFPDWLVKAKEWKQRYPAVLPEFYDQKGSVNSYVFAKTLSEKLQPGAVVVADQGGNLTWTIQAFQVKNGQQLFSAFGNSPMGYALPAAIGAAFARPGEAIICIDGDGGFQMNIQELQTVKYYNLPIKIFILNNHSYGIIKQFQEIYFEGRYTATTPETGYSVPDFIKISEAYGIPTMTISNHQELLGKLDQILEAEGPILCDVILDENQKLIPKLVSVRNTEGRYISRPIEDLSPPLSREELKANMIVKMLDEEKSEKPTEIN